MPVRSSLCFCYSGKPAPLAQLDRASGYEPEGREFESLRAHHLPSGLFLSSTFLRWVGRELLFLRPDPRTNPVPNAGIGAFLAKPFESLNFSLDLRYLSP